MTLRAKYLIFWLLLLAPVYLIGQFSNAIHYTVKDGLPSSTIYNGTEDSLGFMWMGTEAGLVRFDGTHFKVFTTQDGLPDNEVLGELYDKVTDRLWVITYSRAACYYRNGKFYTAKNDSSLRAITCEFGEFISGNPQPGHGVFLYNGASIFECTHDSIIKTEIHEEPKSPIFYVKRWGADMLDVCTNFGTTGHRKGKPDWHYEAFEEVPAFNKGKWVDSTFFRFMPGSTVLYKKMSDGNLERLGEILLPTTRMPTNVILHRNKYVVCVPEDGVYLAEGPGRSGVTKIWTGNVNGIYIDKSGDLWILTNDDGVFILSNSSFISYSAKTGLVHDNITALFYESEGTLYLGNTYGELLSLKNKVLSPLAISGGKAERIRGIMPFDNSMLFITNNSIFHFGLHNPDFITVPHISGGPKAILRVKGTNTVLIGLLASIVEFNTKTKASREIEILKRVIDLAQRPDGTIYCASLDGLYTFANDHLTHVADLDSRLSGRMTSLCSTVDNLLWIGTPANGIMAYDGSKILAVINQTGYPGYHGNICRKIVSSKPDEVWVATNSGINKIKYHTGDSLIVDNITPINMTDGLGSDDANDILVVDSIIYVATSQGLTILNENQMMAASAVPIYITSVRINDKDSTIHNGEYNLTYLQNNLKIEYIGVSLPNAGYLRYQYRLLGSSDKWETTTNTSLEFRSLSAGSYTFEAVVLDKFGNKSKSLARVKFRITPAFYMTLWFWGLMVILILTTGFYIIRARFKRQQRQFEKEQSLNNKIIELEQQALKAQMNPHFIFNCLTSVQHFVNKEDLYSANMYLSNFAKLIRKTLDLSGEQYISLDREVSYLENYVQLEKMRFQEKFQYSITVAKDIDEYATQVPPMLLQPIIENAIRHGLRNMDTDTGLLQIDFTQSGNKVICTIDDNGVGMKKAKELKTTMHVEYQSKGMSLTMSRIHAINMISDKKITIEVRDKYDNNEASGTLFTLSFEQ